MDRLVMLSIPALLLFLGSPAVAIPQLANSAMESAFLRSAFLAAEGNVDANPTMLMIDTGATTSLIDAKWSQVLKSHKPIRKIHIQTTSGSDTRWEYEKMPVTIDGFAEYKLNAVSNDLSTLRDLTGMDVYGSVGMTYMQHICVEFRDGHPRLLKSPEAIGVKNFETPLEFNQFGVPTITVTLPILGSRDAILDTGYTEFLGVTATQAAAMIRSGEAVSVPAATFLNASGIVKKERIVIREVEILGCRYENVPANVGTITHLGLGYFRSRDMILDFPKSKIVVDAEDVSCIRCFPEDASGLRFAWRSGAYFVRRIEKGGASEALDIRVDDRLELFDDVNADQLSIWGIEERLSAAGTSVRLGLVREGKKIEVTLPLSRIFEYPPKWKPRRDDADGFLKSLEADTAGKKE